MAGEAEKRLYDAATRGDLTTLQDVLQEYPYLLDGASFAYSRNLLHIATMRQQAALVEDLLRRNPMLAEDLDSKNSSPLHIAAAKGNFQIVCMLLEVAPDMCWSVDGQGMNPIHIAAKNGHVEILEHLLQLNPSPAMERLNFGGTVLHLCVKHGQLTTLQVLVEKYLGDLVNAKDGNGDTLLHMAVRCNQLEMVRYLVERPNIIVEVRNSTGDTPIEILEAMPSNYKASQIKKILKKYTASSYALDPDSKTRKIMMVVLALIASVAFAAIVNPPGGVWQDDSSTHKAGEAVMATNRPKIYKYFIGFNTGAFVASVIAMYMMLLRSPSVIPISSRIAEFGFSVAFTFVGLSYGASLLVILPNSVKQGIDPAVYAFAGIVFSIAIFMFLAIFWNKRKQSLKKSCRGIGIWCIGKPVFLE